MSGWEAGIPAPLFPQIIFYQTIARYVIENTKFYLFVLFRLFYYFFVFFALGWTQNRHKPILRLPWRSANEFLLTFERNSAILGS